MVGVFFHDSRVSSPVRPFKVNGYTGMLFAIYTKGNNFCDYLLPR